MKTGRFPLRTTKLMVHHLSNCGMTYHSSSIPFYDMLEINVFNEYRQARNTPRVLAKTDRVGIAAYNMSIAVGHGIVTSLSCDTKRAYEEMKNVSNDFNRSMKSFNTENFQLKLSAPFAILLVQFDYMRHKNAEVRTQFR